jgi:multidrug efflux pump subunit AcrA (membrane-fusion protein)
MATLALALMLGACAEPHKDVTTPVAPTRTAATPEKVAAERVGSARLHARITASGSVVARQVTELAAEVPGPLLEILVDVGSTVEKGAALFRVDPGPYEMTLAEARAALALARAESEHAAQEERRLETLLSSRSVSKQHYEQVRTEAAVARARVTQMEARTARATRDLERTLVRAPYAGSIVARLAHEGAMAGSGPILVLQESGALEAVVNVPEATPVPVRAGDPVELFIEALDHALLTRVDRVSALLTRDGRSFVLRVDQGVITPVLVRVGVLGEQQAEILDGIAAGDVVVHGEAVARLGAGQHVEPVFDSGPEPADAADDSPAMPAS